MSQTLYPIAPDLGTIAVATVNITSANILAMNATPVSVLASPGTGKAISVVQIGFEMISTATQYANGGIVTVYYTGGTSNPTSSNIVHVSSIPAAVVNAAAGTSLTILPSNSIASGVVVQAATGLSITNQTAAFITGTGTAKLIIWYQIVTL